MKKIKLIRKAHLYLGIIFAPLILLFAISGFFMINNLHNTKKDGSYTAPDTLVYISRVHEKISRCRFKKKSSYEKPLNSKSLQKNCYIFKYSVIAMSIGLIITVLIGVFLAFKYTRNKIIISICLFLGFVMPTIILTL